MIKTATFKNTDIRFLDQGKGKTIVFLHGFLESLEIWKDFTRELSKKFRVIAIDLPGHGESGCLGYVHSMETMGDSLKAVLKQLRIRKIVLVGHSMGGYAGVAFAEKYPDYIKGLCLFHSTAAADNEVKKKERDQVIKLVKNSKQDLIKNLIPGLFAEKNRKKFSKAITALKKAAKKTPKQGIIAALEGMKERSEREIILRFAAYPILFIVGKEDPVIPFEKIMEQAKLPRNASVLVLENAGHMGFLEAKEETLKRIALFSEKAFK